MRRQRAASMMLSIISTVDAAGSRRRAVHEPAGTGCAGAMCVRSFAAGAVSSANECSYVSMPRARTWDCDSPMAAMSTARKLTRNCS